MDNWTEQLLELRRRMRESLGKAEQAQKDWHKVKDQIGAAHPGAVERRIEERQNLALKDAYNAVVFHRDMASMYAQLVAAEIAVDQEFRRHRPTRERLVGR